MGRTLDCKRARPGFTLVELLTVIVIIGLLVGMITAAAIAARNSGRRASIRMEIAQLDASFGAYKDKYGDYPPDFSFVNDPNPRLQKIGRDSVVRHLRKAFPRYPLPADNDLAWAKFVFDVGNNYWFLAQDTGQVYRLNPSYFDPATAMVFWVGGLPEALRTPVPSAQQVMWTPAGFHADPTMPFRQGGPRMAPLFEFAPERLVARGGMGQTIYVAYLPPYIEQAPYAYFLARMDRGSGRFEYGFTDPNDPNNPNDDVFIAAFYGVAPDNVCVPYLDAYMDPSLPPTNPRCERHWRNPNTFQIITAGLDGDFGLPFAAQPAPPSFRYSKVGVVFPGLGHWSNADNDNQTNFTKGRLEDELE